MADFFDLEPVPPTPDGTFSFHIRCSTVRDGGPSTRHAVTISPDWTIKTPHDLDLERIAVAMGGYLTCVHLADHTIPALRELVQLQARRIVPPMWRESDGRWRLPCDCRPNSYTAASFAADHLRDPTHVARVHNVSAATLGRLLDSIQARWDGRLARLPRRGANLVRELDGIERLWEDGVHPEIVERLHRQLWPHGPAMPTRFYLGAVTARPDLGWLTDTLRAVPDEDVAVWLCWTETELDRRHPDARAAWLRAGVPRQAILGMLRGDYTPAEVARLVARSRRSIPSAASTFAAWAQADCRPSVDDIVLLDELDVDPSYAPSKAAIDWLVTQFGSSVDRTRIGLLLALAGNRRSTLQLLNHGIHDLREAAACIRPEVMSQ